MSENDTQRIFEKLDKLNKEMAELLATTRYTASASHDHETRIRGLEQWQWKVIGIATAISAAASLAVALLTK